YSSIDFKPRPRQRSSKVTRGILGCLWFALTQFCALTSSPARILKRVSFLDRVNSSSRAWHSHLHHFFFLGLAHLFHLLDLVVGEPLDLFERAFFVVFREIQRLTDDEIKKMEEM